MMNSVLKSSTYRSFAYDHLETVVIDMMDPSSLSPEALDYREKVMSEYSVDSYPTTVLLNKEGREILRIAGYDGKGVHHYVQRLKARIPGS